MRRIVSVGAYCGKLSGVAKFNVRLKSGMTELSAIENGFWLYALGPRTSDELKAYARSLGQSNPSKVLDSMFAAGLVTLYPETDEEWSDFMLNYRFATLAYGLGCPGADPGVCVIAGGMAGLAITVGNLTHMVWTLSDGRSLAEAAQAVLDLVHVPPAQVLLQLRRDIPLLMANGMTFLDKAVAL